MTDYATLKIPREDFERHNARRKQMDITWTAYIDGQAPEPADIDLSAIREAAREGVRAELEAVAR